ncbi:thiamine phosphate synthase, partial [Ralstonia pseudosolanacearum]
MSASALRFASAWPDAAALADRLIDRHADAFGRAPHAWSVTDRADDAATAAVLLTTDAAQAERARAAGAAVVLS